MNHHQIMSNILSVRNEYWQVKPDYIFHIRCVENVLGEIYEEDGLCFRDSWDVVIGGVTAVIYWHSGHGFFYVMNGSIEKVTDTRHSEIIKSTYDHLEDCLILFYKSLEAVVHAAKNEESGLC